MIKLNSPTAISDAIMLLPPKLMKGAGEEAGATGMGLLVWGLVLAAVVGYFSLVLLLKALKGRWFWLFGPYCFAAGLATVCFL